MFMGGGQDQIARADHLGAELHGLEIRGIGPRRVQPLLHLRLHVVTDMGVGAGGADIDLIFAHGFHQQTIHRGGAADVPGADGEQSVGLSHGIYLITPAASPQI
ncbi:hypothetical protein GCM10009672_17260 [Nesterenkonia lutea]